MTHIDYTHRNKTLRLYLLYMLFGYIFAVIYSSALQDEGGQVPARSAESYRATAPFPGLMCGLPYQA
jgi:hypothetical protein